MIQIAALGCCLLAASSRLHPAAADPLDVRTGLWEFTTSGGTPAITVPQLPPDMLAKLTPEQRAKLEERMAAARDLAGKPTVRHICVTQTTLDKGVHVGERASSKCARTALVATASVMDVDVACKADPNAGFSGKLHLQATDREHITGALDGTMAAHGASLPLHRDTAGRWLAEDCGEVKPFE